MRGEEKRPFVMIYGVLLFAPRSSSSGQPEALVIEERLDRIPEAIIWTTAMWHLQGYRTRRKRMNAWADVKKGRDAYGLTIRSVNRLLHTRGIYIHTMS
jgi:hypothetical protein